MGCVRDPWAWVQQTRRSSLTPQIVSPNHLLTAIQTTLIGALTPTGDLKTKSHNIHSEILLSLSPNNNITDSIRRHGLSDKTTNLIVVRVGSAEATQEDIWKLVDGVVRGELVRLEEVRRAVDWSRVDKVSSKSCAFESHGPLY